MDTAAYLTRQGWRGSGHSLHPSGHGIAKPLLVSKKNDVLGLGNRKNDALADQWWLKAFDNTLKQVNPGAVDGASKSAEKITSTFRRSFHSNALYSNFVKGEGLSGTQTPAVKPQTRMEPNRQLGGFVKDGTVLQSIEKGKDNNRNADHAGEPPLVRLKMNRKAEQVTAPEFSGEKGAAYLETRPLVDRVEEIPRLKRKIGDKAWEIRNPWSCDDKNFATFETSVLDSDPPRKRQRGRKGLNEADDIPTLVSGGDQGLADAIMDLSDYEMFKNSWLKPKTKEKPGKPDCQERQVIEISDDEMNILSKLEEQLSNEDIENTMGQEEQAQSANGWCQRKQPGMHGQQVTKQEIQMNTKMRRKERKLRKGKRRLEKDLERISQPKTALLSHVADDLSKDRGSDSRERDAVRNERGRNRILGDDAGQPTGQPTSTLTRKQRKKNRMLEHIARQPTSSLPPMASHAPRENMIASLEKDRTRKPRRKNRILVDDAAQPTSSFPPTMSLVSGGNKSAPQEKTAKRLSSGKHMGDPLKTSRSLSRAANDLPGQGKHGPRTPRKIVGRNETMFEYDDEPVATPMDAITQFLKSRLVKQ